MVQIFGGVPNVPWTIAMRVPSGDQTGSNELYNRREMLLVSGRVGNVEQHMYLGSLLDQFWVR